MLAAAVSSPVFGILLVAHITAALVGFGALGATGIQGWRLARTRDPARLVAIRRYFRPGVNWAARCVYLVPVFGVALIVASGGTYRPEDTFVQVGIGLWVAAVLTGELLVWPAERVVQRALAGQAAPASVTLGAAAPGTPVAAAPGTPVETTPVAAVETTPVAAGETVPSPSPGDALVVGGGWTDGPDPGPDVARACRQLAAAVPVVSTLFVAAVSVMAAKP